MASVDDIAAALLAAQQPTTPAMGAIMAARDQLATQPARLGPPDIGEAPIGDGGQLSSGTAWGNRAADIASRLPGHMIGSLASLPQRAIDAASADYANRGDYSADRPLYSAGPAVETAMHLMGGVPVQGGEIALGAGPIRAYHGSPHDFDAFDLSKIGTGEGAQAYGHGLYFAENPSTAQFYRDVLGGASNDSVEQLARQHLQLAGNDASKAAAQLRARAAGERRDPFSGINPDDMQGAAEKLEAGWLPNQGKMYEVNINADPEHFLDWDKPLAQQSRQTQDAVRAAYEKKSGYQNIAPYATGEEISKLLGDKAQSAQALSEVGIPGIKYLDQGSRSTGEGSRNYVVFNDKLIDIARKYGMGSLAALPPATLAAMGAIATPNEQNQ